MMPWRWSMGQLLFLLVFSVFLNLISLSIFCWSDDLPPKEVQEGSSIANLRKIWLIILVMTGPANRERRDAIRTTWAKSLPTDSMVLHVIGTESLPIAELSALRSEQATHSDLILFDRLADSYFNLTRKLLVSFDHVANTYSPTFVMKCDDDTFIDGRKLTETLRSMPTEKLYYGYFTGAARVKQRGQWAEPNFHLCDRYLPYARGGGYIVSGDLVKYISDNKDLLQIYNSEDVSMGVWLSAIDVNRQHSVQFDTEAVSRGCLNHHIVSHKQSVDKFKAKHHSLIETGKLCEKENRLRPEYEYNWTVPPSECCKPQ